jgi:UDP-N-acetylglucosamine transferase subunit ALG13
MLVKCSNNTLCTTLTIGKEYLVIDEGDKYYVILDDTQNEITTKKERFTVVEDSDLAKKTKATITELNYQLNNDFSDIKDFKIRKNSKGEIKEIIVKFKYE